MSQLALFDIEVKYRSGRLNKVADTLSRCPEDENVDLECTRNDKSDQLNEDDNNQLINDDKDLYFWVEWCASS